MKRWHHFGFPAVFAAITAMGVDISPVDPSRDIIRREVVEVHAALVNTSISGPPGSFKTDASGKSTFVESEPVPRVGDHIIIRGSYNLVSMDKARITLVEIPKKKSLQLSPQLPSIEVKKGSGNFELTYDLEREGRLWLVFTSIPDGKPGPGMSFVEDVHPAWKGDSRPDKEDHAKPQKD